MNPERSANRTVICLRSPAVEVALQRRNALSQGRLRGVDSRIAQRRTLRFQRVDSGLQCLDLGHEAVPSRPARLLAAASITPP